MVKEKLLLLFHLKIKTSNSLGLTLNTMANVKVLKDLNTQFMISLRNMDINMVSNMVNAEDQSIAQNKNGTD